MNNPSTMNTGGNLLASGGYGCVFSPALMCEGETKRQTNKITKLMTEKHALSEYDEINSIREKLQDIKNFQNYFLIYGTTLCKPSRLKKSDLSNYEECRALPKDGITKKNINTNLDRLLSLNIPNGGLAIDDYLYKDGTFDKMYKVHTSLSNLFKKGILPMNKKNIYHGDIKDSNILVDNSYKCRLIDWGLTVEYNPFKDQSFPRTWRNRPLQFNVPFSVILFTDRFIEKYSTFLKNGGTPDRISLKPFIVNYISVWMKERGPGHYKFINEIMFVLFSNSITNVSSNHKTKIVETQITMNYIVNHLVEVLVNFNKYGDDIKLNLRDYLDNVFIKIVDVWGFVCAYFPFAEILFNNYSNLTKQQLEVYKKIQFIFGEFLFNPIIKPININTLHTELKNLGNLLKNVLTENKYVKNERVKTASTKKVTSIKTRKNKKVVSFKRLPKKQRFKNPFLISLLA
jgi:serine/threonine protein kinase